MMAIDRTLGTEATSVTVKVGTKKDEEGGDEVDLEETYTLPKYVIDSSSHHGLKKTTMGEVVFENVTFAYPTRPNNMIFNGLNLKIESGKTVALVGPSGGGKSTTIGLIERFYDPIGGRITLDGIDMKDLNVTHVRSQIGYVGQEPALFATTIENNIKYGKPDATREEIEEAAIKANAHDFISSFPDGYSTQVGDKGLQLSGGQKQRIAIARVLVGNPKLLLLGEFFGLEKTPSIWYSPHFLTRNDFNRN
jgi:ATP-binding cassette subfamily B (MDR/TAP) protein 1